MKTRILFFIFVLWAAFAGLVNCGAVFADQEEKPKELPILQKWSGDYPVSELRRLPENLRIAAGRAIIPDQWHRKLPLKGK